MHFTPFSILSLIVCRHRNKLCGLLLLLFCWCFRYHHPTRTHYQWTDSIGDGMIKYCITLTLAAAAAMSTAPTVFCLFNNPIISMFNRREGWRSCLPWIEFRAIDQRSSVVHRQHITIFRFGFTYFGHKNVFHFQFVFTIDGGNKARENDYWFNHL